MYLTKLFLRIKKDCIQTSKVLENYTLEKKIHNRPLSSMLRIDHYCAIELSYLLSLKVSHHLISFVNDYLIKKTSIKWKFRNIDKELSKYTYTRITTFLKKIFDSKNTNSYNLSYSLLFRSRAPLCVVVVVATNSILRSRVNV